ncbi:Zn(2)-C6 fungal-type domain-containing protein [Mycena chlorophos]|uniref:Zn(2)-C6 fungal-type domain-containing protein n=1 Tax=Mycena chlorophos TaxID=658473 RepID=A0A8H6TB26_MYCCL|nr:Zn(2)-C6 fungal-type domain-containing protein [Mycena chlorophos]
MAPKRSPSAHESEFELPTVFTKRRRSIIACTNCRKRKTRCFSTEDFPENPCERCDEKGLKCRYETISEQRAVEREHERGDRDAASSSDSGTSSPSTPPIILLPTPGAAFRPTPASWQEDRDFDFGDFDVGGGHELETSFHSTTAGGGGFARHGAKQARYTPYLHPPPHRDSSRHGSCHSLKFTAGPTVPSDDSERRLAPFCDDNAADVPFTMTLYPTHEVADSDFDTRGGWNLTEIKLECVGGDADAVGPGPWEAEDASATYDSIWPGSHSYDSVARFPRGPEGIVLDLMPTSPLPTLSRPLALRQRPDTSGTQCFTERSASVDDCHTLLAKTASLVSEQEQCTDSEFAEYPSAGQTPMQAPIFLDWRDLSLAQSGAGGQPIFRPLCEDSCCLFTNSPNISIGALVEAGSSLLACEQASNGLISGVSKTATAGVCLAHESAAGFCAGHLR